MNLKDKSRYEYKAIQPIEKTGLEKQNTAITHVTNLFPYFLNPLFPCKRAAYWRCCCTNITGAYTESQ